MKDTASFKAYLLKLVDDDLTDKEKKERKGKKTRDEKKDLALGLLKYLRIAA